MRPTALSFVSAIALLSCLASPLAAYAETPESDLDTLANVQECHGVLQPMARLVCYDAASDYVAPEAEDDNSGTGGWRLVEQTDEFTNATTSFAVLDSDHAGRRMTDAPIALYVRCDGSGGSEIFILSGGYIGARNDRVPVRYRFGEEQPISETWSESTNGRAVFLPRGYNDFRSGLIEQKDFVFEITDYRGSKYSARFEGVARGFQHVDYILGGCS